MSRKMKGVLLAAGGASLWGGSGAAAQYLFSRTDINTNWLAAMRLLLAGALLLLWSTYKAPHQVRALATNKKNIFYLVMFAVFGMLNSQISYFLAVKYSNAPTATVIQYLQPVIIIVWLAIAERHWPSRLDNISVVVALIGTFYLVTGGHLNTLTLTPRAILWGVWCAVAAALYTLLPRPLLEHFDALAVCGFAMLLAGVCIIPELFIHPVPHLDLLGWLLIAYIIVGGTMFSYTMFLQSMRYISPAVTGILSAFEPLVATLLAVTLLGTRLTVAAVFGSVLILLTTVIQAIPMDRIPGLHHLTKKEPWN
ncbi:DMT family transporter [Limosilactobacillus frumenti]|nr:EamA family transporter [Limosilactobacillus frumenti]QFG72022.1 EamA family transporter [Limosilactobacillus frumenti]